MNIDQNAVTPAAPARWTRIQRWAHIVADFQARFVLTVLYGLFVVPKSLSPAPVGQ